MPEVVVVHGRSESGLMRGRADDRAIGAAVRALARNGSVLCFHGLREDGDPVQSVMNLRLSHFVRILNLVRASSTIVPLHELHERWASGKPTRGLVAVSFDDAYHSLLATADKWYEPDPFPISIFVVTRASGTGETYWWDRIETLSAAVSLEERVVLENAIGIPKQLLGQVDVVHGPMRNLRQWILGAHAGQPPATFTDLLSQLESRHRLMTSQRAMRISELHQMARLGPVSFGVHTVNHRALPMLSDGEAVMEVRGAWERLQEWSIPSIVRIAAAPFGLIDSRTMEQCRNGGMTGCLTLNDRTLRSQLGNDRGLMPRCSMSTGTTAMRLAFRLSGLRDVLMRDSASHPGFSAVRSDAL